MKFGVRVFPPLQTGEGKPERKISARLSKRYKHKATPAKGWSKVTRANSNTKTNTSSKHMDNREGLKKKVHARETERTKPNKR